MEQIILFLFLVLFPFGQIIRIGILQPLDIVAGLGVFWAIYKKYPEPPVFKYFKNFLFIAFASWFLSLFIFRRVEVLIGFLYFVRLSAYFYFLIFVINYLRNTKREESLILNSLLSISAISAIFGWIQYFALTSLKAFTVWGWDDHYLRLAGSFLDPTYLGLIIVFGLIIAVNKLVQEVELKNFALSIFLLVSLAFTYSRASYLAFFVGLVVLGIYQKRIRQFLFWIVGLVLMIVFLPTSANRVLEITRSFSVLGRVGSYVEAVSIFKTSPIFGVGYDNLCLAKANFNGFVNFSSHSCSGTDSSLLFVLATTGVVGFMIFIHFIYKIIISLKQSPDLSVIAASSAALSVHSLFSNSLFYPWVMGWMIILLALNLWRKV